MEKTSMLNKVLDYPYVLFDRLSGKGWFDWMPDKIYLRMKFRGRMHRKLNLKNPVTYNEKLQWLKLFDRKKEYTLMADKYEVKKYISQKIGKEYVIPTIGVWDKFDDIDFSKLPNQFVLKCTHDSGGIVICTDKSKFDLLKARAVIETSLKKNFYRYGREWVYRDIQPRIIAEQYMVDESGYELKDYKIFCFAGVAKSLFVASDRGSDIEETKFDFFDMDFNHLPLVWGHPHTLKELVKPKCLGEMKNLAEKVSKDIPHVRVDFYSVNERVYFGEMTFFHFGGFMPVVPEKWDYIFGDWINLPETSKLKVQKG